MLNSIDIHKQQESIILKRNAKIFAGKLAKSKAQEDFMSRIYPMTVFTEEKKKKFIDKITQHYEPVFYKEIINRIISQKVIEENNRIFRQKRNKENKKKLSLNKENNTEESIINNTRELYDLINSNDSDIDKEEEKEQSSSIMNNLNQRGNLKQNNEHLIMSILNKQ